MSRDVAEAYDQVTDEVLIGLSRAGDQSAYAELFVRHRRSAEAAGRALVRSRHDVDDLVAEAFTRVYRRLRDGGGPTIAFRPYLVSAVRNVFLDGRRRRQSGELPTELVDDAVDTILLARAAEAPDRAMALEAFASLPERWQLVLWHLDVEQASPVDLAPMLGLSPNAVSALAYRAREGLRQEFLNAHVRRADNEACYECRQHIGGYVRDRLSDRERRHVDLHLSGCAECAAVIPEVAEINVVLRGAVIPALLAVAPSAYFGAGAGGALRGLAVWYRRAPRRTRYTTAAAGAVVAIVAVTAVTLGVTDRVPGESRPATESPGPTATVPTPRASLAPASPITGDGSSVVTVSPVDASVAPPPNGTTPPIVVAGQPTTDATFDPPVPVPTATPLSTTSASSAGAEVSATTTDVPAPMTSMPPATESTQPPAPATTTMVPTTAPAPTTLPTTTPPAPALPTIDAVVTALGPAIPGGLFEVSVSLAESPVSPVSPVSLLSPATLAGERAAFDGTITITITVSPELHFVDADRWACVTGSSTLTCTAGTSATTLRFSVDQAVGSSPLTVRVTDATGATVRSAGDVTVSATGASLRALFAGVVHGATTMIGNGVLSCRDSSPTCVDERTGAIPANRQQTDLTFIDVDTDPTTFDSSSANLSVDGTVLRAYLVWSGDTEIGSARAPDPSARGVVKLASPATGAGWVTLSTTNVTDGSDPGTYRAWIDVTEEVTAGGGGVYTVANVQTTATTSGLGGWALAVVVENPASPRQLVSIGVPNAGLGPTTPVSFDIDFGPLQGGGLATWTMAAFDGELGLSPETVVVDGVDLGVDNFFDSSMPADRTPNHANNFGATIVTASSNRAGATRATIEIGSGREVVTLLLVNFEVPIG